MATRNFALIAGVFFLAIGVLGFIPGLRTMPPPDTPPIAIETAYGYLFGLFPVNILHNLVHIAIGAWGVFAYKTLDTSIGYARSLTIIYAVLAVFGFIPYLNNLGGLIPLFSHDIWLHAGTAAIAAYFGYARERSLTT